MRRRPNVLFIMTDQMRADAIGCLGKQPIQTPHLDALARGGTVFSNCVTVSPICAPARAALLSGLYPHQMGVWNNDPHTFPSGVENWVKKLRDAGYRTSVIGKTHYYPYNGSVPDMRAAEPLVRSYGYDHVDEIPGPRVSGRLLSNMTAQWRDLGYMDAVRDDLASRYAGNHAVARPSVLPLELYPDVYVGRKAVEYLTDYDETDPFFCFVSFGGPHDPWDCPREYASRYDGAPMPDPLPPFRDECPGRPKGRWDEPVEYPAFSLADVSAIRRDYAGKVTLIDDQIGAVLNAVDRKGLRDDTVVVFTSDHGEMNGDHGRLYKSNFLRSALNVPLIIRVPGRKAGECRAMVELLDIGPTIAELTGTVLGYPQCGRSVASLPDGAVHRDVVFSEYDREVMVCDGRWKMVVNAAGRPYLLFDLKNDPDEQLNLAGAASVSRREAELLLRVTDFFKETSGFSYTPDNRR
jgi:choline-sulfatase